MTDKEFLEGETECPLYGEVVEDDPCPCGSGKKYKKCCGRMEVKDEN